MLCEKQAFAGLLKVLEYEMCEETEVVVEREEEAVLIKGGGEAGGKARGRRKVQEARCPYRRTVEKAPAMVKVKRDASGYKSARVSAVRTMRGKTRSGDIISNSDPQEAGSVPKSTRRNHMPANWSG